MTERKSGVITTDYWNQKNTLRARLLFRTYKMIITRILDTHFISQNHKFVDLEIVNNHFSILLITQFNKSLNFNRLFNSLPDCSDEEWKLASQDTISQFHPEYQTNIQQTLFRHIHEKCCVLYCWYEELLKLSLLTWNTVLVLRRRKKKSQIRMKKRRTPK